MKITNDKYDLSFYLLFIKKLHCKINFDYFLYLSCVERSNLTSFKSINNVWHIYRSHNVFVGSVCRCSPNYVMYNLYTHIPLTRCCCLTYFEFIVKSFGNVICQTISLETVSLNTRLDVVDDRSS